MQQTINSLPEAYIAVGRNRQKIYPNKKIYLNDGTEFQLEIFNPTTGTIAAKIYINDEAISNSLIVIRPGQREYLDRYIDDNRKFLFETYEVEDSPESKAAIAKNGFVRVEFFRTAPPRLNYGGSGTIWINNNNWYGGSGYPGWGGSGIIGGAGTTGGYVYPSTTTDLPQNLNGSITYTSGISGNDGPSSAFYSSTANAAGETFGLHDGQACMDSMSFSASNASIETGRIEGGGASDQNFTNYYGEFESWSFTSSEYQILPNSIKPVEVSQLRQYCPGCRSRIRKSTWKFCPQCSEPLD